MQLDVKSKQSMYGIGVLDCHTVLFGFVSLLVMKTGETIIKAALSFKTQNLTK